jgi:hypothetical protein
MKAIVQPRYGTADVLELADVPMPTVGANDVLARHGHSGQGGRHHRGMTTREPFSALTVAVL